MRAIIAAVFLVGCGAAAVGDGENGGAGGAPASPSRGTGGSGGSTMIPPGPTPAATGPCKERKVAPGLTRRLTHTEYNNTVRDLLSDATAPGKDFPADSAASGFSNQAVALLVSPLHADGYLAAAGALAANAVKNLKGLLGCDAAGAAEEACLKTFITAFGKRAYRRPLLNAEADDLLALYRTFRGSGLDVTGGVEWLVETMLQSPHFLYRVELGAGTGAVVPLSQYEIASRLSYGFVGSMPDAALFAAADAGKLKTPEEIMAQARRLLALPGGRPTMETFLAEWFGLPHMTETSKDTKLFPLFTPAMKDAMVAETKALASYATWEAKGLQTLLTEPVGFVDANLAKIYGVATPAGTALAKVAMEPGQRAGVLTQPSLMSIYGLTNQSDPIRRGKFVRTQLLCQTLPPPLGNVPPLKDPDPNSTTRERLTMHRDNPACTGCHTLLDPIGFAFESYDAIGRWRTMDGPRAVDASGEVVSSRDIDGKIRGARELATKLAGSDEVRECAARFALRYALGRLETDDDACSVGIAKSALERSGSDLRELMLAVTQTDAFMYRNTEGLK
jgi:hypothetical protein